MNGTLVLRIMNEYRKSRWQNYILAKKKLITRKKGEIK